MNHFFFGGGGGSPYFSRTEEPNAVKDPNLVKAKHPAGFKIRSFHILLSNSMVKKQEKDFFP